MKDKVNFELEYLRSENEKLKSQLSNNNQNDIMELVNLATSMIEALELCRKQTLPINLAKQIDYILSQAKDL